MTRKEAIRLLDTQRAKPSTDYQMAEVYTMAIKALEQEPRKGHWINKHRLFDQCSCSAECSSCHKRSKGYMRGSRFGLVSTYYDFCPRCGSDNREAGK